MMIIMDKIQIRKVDLKPTIIKLFPLSSVSYARFYMLHTIVRQKELE